MSIIIDLDNCISDDAWRIPRIRWDLDDPTMRYEDYHALSAFDEPGNHDLWQGHKHAIIVFTARPEIHRATTEEWFRRNGIKIETMLMRGNDEHTISVVLKEQMLLTIDVLGFNIEHSIVHAFDDRPDVVAMYKRYGIPATVRAIHNVCAYLPPDELSKTK